MFRESCRSSSLLSTMSLNVKDLKLWSLSLACALNNDSILTHLLCRVIYRYIAWWLFFIHQCFYVNAKILWNPCRRHYLKNKKRNEPSFTEALSLHCLCNLGLEMKMSPSFFMETCMYGNEKSLRLCHVPTLGIYGTHWLRLCLGCLRLLPLSSTLPG